MELSSAERRLRPARRRVLAVKRRPPRRDQSSCARRQRCNPAERGGGLRARGDQRSSPLGEAGQSEETSRSQPGSSGSTPAPAHDTPDGRCPDAGPMAEDTRESTSVRGR
ncbi:unnamed protein product [Pleuronectes platessa]|uniref:Uncharacterized protein n=1 Tax=Pleuronectes platessa TaxID=8262 RepID=A0A9N7YEU1_PLEPL|nr:unnamed protein product [Pleuronectes platessa]